MSLVPRCMLQAWKKTVTILFILLYRAILFAIPLSSLPGACPSDGVSSLKDFRQFCCPIISFFLALFAATWQFFLVEIRFDAHFIRGQKNERERGRITNLHFLSPFNGLCCNKTKYTIIIIIPNRAHSASKVVHLGLANCDFIFVHFLFIFIFSLYRRLFKRLISALVIV